MQAQYWISGATAFGDRDSHKGRVVNLQLEQNYFTTLEQLQVWHKLDESSPLFRMRDKLHMHLDGIEISVTAVDMASLQQVMFYKRYEKSDFIRDAVFENTLSGGSGSTLEADHSKLDRYNAENVQKDPSTAKKGRRASLTAKLASARGAVHAPYAGFRSANAKLVSSRPMSGIATLGERTVDKLRSTRKRQSSDELLPSAIPSAVNGAAKGVRLPPLNGAADGVKLPPSDDSGASTKKAGWRRSSCCGGPKCPLRRLSASSASPALGSGVQLPSHAEPGRQCV